MGWKSHCLVELGLSECPPSRPEAAIAGGT
jgi:hypothetical protein